MTTQEKLCITVLFVCTIVNRFSSSYEILRSCNTMDNKRDTENTKQDGESKAKSTVLESRMKHQLQELEMKIAMSTLKEPELRLRIECLKRKENEMKATIEKLSREVEDVRMSKKMVDLKMKDHSLRTSYYKERMENFKREIPDFLIVDEYIENDELDREILALKTKLDALQDTYEKIPENNFLKAEEIQTYIQMNPSQKILNLMRNIRTLDMNIEMRKTELQEADE